MRVAITGGTGLIGRHLARALLGGGHEVILVARGADRRDQEVRHLPGARFLAVGVDDADGLRKAFARCDTVAHCAGINRERGRQTYQRVHAEGTRNVVQAAKRAGAKKIVLLSFLRARPACGSRYHESKWEAEEIVRSSEMDYTVIKAGLIFGRGDHLLAHLHQALRIIPVFALVGFQEKPIRPTAVEDVVRIMKAASVEGRLSRQTVAVTGPEELTLREAVARVARVLGKRPLMFRMPVFVHRLMAWGLERTMDIPLVSLAQVRMLAEGIAEPLPGSDPLPPDLRPTRCFTDDQIRHGLREARGGEIAGPRGPE